MRTDERHDHSRLPSITALLAAAETHPELSSQSAATRADLFRTALDAMRREISSGSLLSNIDCTAEALRRSSDLLKSRLAVRLVPVINATGVVLHTGLGRSVLAHEAIARINEAALGACNLEIDLETGRRGHRGRYAERLLCQLTGAESALIVNNNAAATLLVLHGLARGREVIVSRGQLIEIGGSFRMPEVMSAGGAILREVGTTNKTHLADYERAISTNTALILHVHTSNYRVMGFSETPELASLARFARQKSIPLFDDLGSGAILDDELWRAAGEPTAVESLRCGADVVAFSGDKLLGGPQSGILLGKSAIINQLRQEPMARALRIDKLTSAALEATLELYLDPAKARAGIPTLAMLGESIESLTKRARALASRLKQALPGEYWHVEQDESFAGGGSLPVWPLPTAVIKWRPRIEKSLETITQQLRLGRPAVLPRIHDQSILFDLRTIADGQFEMLVQAIVCALQDG